MARYADRECEDCGIVLPADQMMRLNEKTPSWVGSGSTRYKFKRIDLCGPCYTKRNEDLEEAIEAERKAENRHFLHYVIKKAIIGASILFMITLLFAALKSSDGFDSQTNSTSDDTAAASGIDQKITPETDATSSIAGSVKGDDDYIATAKVAIKNQARESESLVFANVRVVRHGDGSVNVCGKVNGANGFGGKTGFQDFVWGTPTSHIAGLTMYDPSNLGPTLSAWGEGCLAIGPGDKDASPQNVVVTSPAPPQITAPVTPEPPLTRDDRSLPQVVHDADRLDEACRGGQTNLDVVCKERDGAFEKARAEGWCLGDDQTPYADAIWHRCSVYRLAKPTITVGNRNDASPELQ